MSRTAVPWASRNSAVPRWPSEAAIIRGVRPCLSAMFTSAPWFSNRSTICTTNTDIFRLKHQNTYEIEMWLFLRCRKCPPASVPAARRWRVARCPCGWTEPQRHPAPIKDGTRPASPDLLLLSVLGYRESLLSEQFVCSHSNHNTKCVVWWCCTCFTPQCVEVVYLSSFFFLLIFLRQVKQVWHNLCISTRCV